jgi:SAM-dependent methyltransferase
MIDRAYVSTAAEAISGLQSVIDRSLKNKNTVSVLEAGCGSTSHVSFGPNARVVGIDISARQLERNTSLEEDILGDIQTYDLPSAAFDAIVCWDVLEHLARPEDALGRFVKAAKGGGLIVLAFPNVLSLKGLVTKFSPHSFHVWAYRHIFGNPRAGQDDCGPFPTFLRFSLRHGAIKRFARDNRLSVEYFRLYESRMQANFRNRYKMCGRSWRLIQLITRMLSLGRIDARLSDCFVVLKKT